MTTYESFSLGISSCTFIYTGFSSILVPPRFLLLSDISDFDSTSDMRSVSTMPSRSASPSAYTSMSSASLSSLTSILGSSMSSYLLVICTFGSYGPSIDSSKIRS
jgi:hypothetical protein